MCFFLFILSLFFSLLSPFSFSARFVCLFSFFVLQCRLSFPSLVSLAPFERGCFSRQRIAFCTICLWVDDRHCQHLPAVASKRSQEHFVQLAFCYPMNMGPKSLEMPSRPGHEGSAIHVTLKVFFDWRNPNNTLT